MSAATLLAATTMAGLCLLAAGATAPAGQTPTTATTAAANVPRKFYEPWKNYTGRYFVAYKLEEGVEFTTELSEAHEIAHLGPTEMALEKPPLILHVEKLDKNFDYVTVKDAHSHLEARCASFADFPAAGGTCRQVGRCTFTFPGTTTTAHHVRELVLVGGPNVTSMEPSCPEEGSPVFSGWLLVAPTATQQRVFMATPKYYYAHTSPGTAAAATSGHRRATAPGPAPATTTTHALTTLDKAKAAWGTEATRSAIVVDANSTAEYIPGGSLMTARVKASAHVDESVPLKTSSATLRSVICDVGDTSSMNMYNGIGRGHKLTCAECNTVADLYAVCLEDESCQGYTTVLETDHGVTKEVPLYLHYGTTGYDASATYHGSHDVMYYEKQRETARTCKLKTLNAGTVDIYVLQNYLAQSTVSVYSGHDFVTECGKSSKFAGNGRLVHGHDHSCGTYMLCTTLDLWVDGEIKVVSHPTMRQGGCEQSMSVLFNLTSLHETSHAPPSHHTTPVPIDTSVFQVARPLLKDAENVEEGVETEIKFYGQHLRSIALQVDQSGFMCQGRNCSESVIEVAVKRNGVKEVVQRCGGTAGFYEGAGESDQCHDHFHCAAPTALTDYSGMLYVKVKMEELYYRSHNCRRFVAELEASSTSTSDAFLLVDHDGFLASPLFIFPQFATAQTTTTSGHATPSTSGGGHRRQLLSTPPAEHAPTTPATPPPSTASAPATEHATPTPPPHGAAPTDAHATPAPTPALSPLQQIRTVASTHFTHEPLLINMDVGSFTHPYNAYYVDYNSHVPLPSELAGRSSFACVIDHVGTSHTTCTVTVPANATHMKIEVAQTDFATNEFHFDVARHGTPTTVRMAGGPKYGFNGRKGRSGLCHTYFAAADEFLYTSRTQAKWEHLSITVPNTVSSGECDVAFAALIHFDERPIPDLTGCAAGGGFVCVSEMECLEHDTVCDGVIDCGNGKDESPCANWRLVEEGKRFQFTAAGAETHHTGVHALRECKRQAVLAGTNAFAYDEHHETCIIYAKTAVDPALRAPSRYLIEQERVELFVHLEGEVTEYNKCSEALSCNGRGTLHHAASLRDGDPCECTCHRQYTGETCETLKRLQNVREMVAVFPKVDEGDVHPSGSAIGAAILGRNHEVSIETEFFEFYNETHEAMGFTLDNVGEAGAAEAYAMRLLEEAHLLREINHRLEEAVQPQVEFFTARTSIALYETMAGCDKTGGRNSYACRLINIDHSGRSEGDAAEDGTFAPVDRRRVSETSLTTAETPASHGTTAAEEDYSIDLAFIREVKITALQAADMTVTLTPRQALDDPEAARIIGHLTTQVVRCNSTNIAHTTVGQCEVATCVVVAHMHLAHIDVTATQASNPNCHRRAGMQVVGMHEVPLPPAESHEPIYIHDPRNKGQLIGPIIGLVVAVVLFVMGLQHIARHASHVNETAAGWPGLLPEPEEGTGATIAHTFIDEKIVQEERKGADPRRLGISLIILAILILFFMVLTLIIYSKSVSRENNYEALLEHFRDPLCADSPIAFLPYRVSRVPPWHRGCQRLAAEGDANKNLVVKADCREGPNGTHVVLMSASGSYDACREMTPIEVPANVCLRLEDFFGEEMVGTGYTAIRCLTQEDGERRFELFVNMTEAGEEKNHLAISEPTHHLQGGFTTRDSANNTVYNYPFVYRQHKFVSTSSHATRLGSIHDAESFHGNLDSRRIIVHTGNEWLQKHAVHDSNSTTLAIESANLEHMDDLPANIRALSPDHSDYPLGDIYNNWQSSGEASGTAAGSDAHRYYFMKGSVFDIGDYFGPELSHDVSGEGVTIQVWVRLDERSNGFVFALADGYEDDATGGNPIIDRAIELIAAGHGQWFEKTWRLYYGLFVNGGDQSVHFVMGEPEDCIAASAAGAKVINNQSVVLSGGAFVDLRWDMRLLGMTRVFNGLWHRLDIVLENKNSRTDAQLYVDGETSLSVKGWSQCAPRRPSRVQTPHVVNVSSLVLNSVTSDGVMYIGYFNGGAHGFEVERHVMVKDEATVKSTGEVWTYRKINEKGYKTIAGVLLGLASLGLIYVLTMIRYCFEDDGSDEAVEQKALVLYQAMMLHELREEGGNKAAYARPKFIQVRQWLGVHGQLLYDVLEEMYCNTVGDRYEREVIHALWKATHAHSDKGKREPTAAEWNKFVANAWFDEAADAEKGEDLWRDDAENKPAPKEGDEETPEEEPKILITGTAFAASPTALIVLSDAMQRQKMVVKVADGLLCFQMKAEKTKGEGGDEAEEAEGEGDEDAAEEGVAGDDEGADDAAAEGDDFDLGLANAIMPAATSTDSGGSASGGASNPFGEVVGVLFHVIQTVAMYTAAVGFPAVYIGSFGAAFNFLALDFTQSLPGVGTMVTPILQFCAGFVVTCLMIFASVTDHKVFMLNACTYTQRRDEKESVKKNNRGDPAVQAILARSQAFPLEHEPECPYDFDVKLMHARARGSLDVASFELGDDNEWNEGDKVETHEGTFVKKKKADIGAFIAPGADEESELEQVGGRCRKHDTLLTATFQNTVTPAQNVRRCCVVENGVRCNNFMGVMHHCEEECTNDDTDEEYTCDFALCAAHYRPSPLDGFLADWKGTAKDIKEGGAAFLFTAMVVAVTGMCYMPFMKTAAMIVVCHPFYQCEFEFCWEAPDMKFSVAAYMAIFFLAFFGLGVPLVEIVALKTRRSWLMTMFAAPQYQGRYQEAPEEEAKEGEHPNAEDKYNLNPRTPRDSERGDHMYNPDAPVKNEEWARFLTTDSSQLAGMYNAFTLPWMYLAPIFLAFKFILLIPAVFLEPESFAQLTGIAVCEGLYFVFVYLTAPYMSVVTDVTAKVGSCHQLFLIGFQAMHVVKLFNGNRKGMSDWMLAVTTCFLVFVFIELFMLKVMPVIKHAMHVAKLRETLQKLGMPPAKSATLYLALKDPVVEVPKAKKIIPVANEPKAAAELPPQTTAGAPVSEVKLPNEPMSP